MKLLRRRSAARIAVTPGEARPAETVRATVELPEALDRVSSARVALGYRNTFDYRWAGRRDAAGAYDDTSIATTGMQGTSYGSDRESTEWVGVLAEDLPIAGGTLEAGSRDVALRIPSWAPGSSEQLVEWAARLEIDRAGRPDVDELAPFAVRVPAPTELPAAPRFERLAGRSTEIEIRPERDGYAAGEEVTGTIAITPHDSVPEADVAVFLQLERVSHPVDRTPADGRTWDSRPYVTVAKPLALTAGRRTELPFAVTVAPDAAPSAEAVHGSLVWWIGVRIFYKGFSEHVPERARRELVVWNAAA